MIRPANGWTLIELVILVTVAATLLGVALPSFQRFLDDQRRITTANRFVASTQLARQAAITRRRSVSVCPTRDGVRCVDEWRHGWMVFLEPRGWRAEDAVPEAARLALEPGIHPSVALVANRTRFRFRPGRQRATNGTAVICPRQGGGTRSAVVVAPTGRVRTSNNAPHWADTVCR